MSDVNIRNVDPALVSKVKSEACLEGKTLKDIVIEMFERYVAEKQKKKKQL